MRTFCTASHILPALLAYEFLITFDQEVEMFWVRKMTGASVLFLSNRYLLLLGYILVMCEYIPMSDSVRHAPLAL